MSEQREALAEDFERDFSRSTPEKFWDAAFWRDKGWLPGSLDVADRKRIVVGVFAALLDSPALASLLADAEQRVAATVERLPELTEGPLRVGTKLWPECDQDAYSLAIEEAQTALRAALIPGAADRVRAEAVVWVIETGDYEQRMVFGIADSSDAAVAYVKSEYGEPYRVTWESAAASSDGFVLRGHFEAVQGYSTEHVADFDIKPEQLRTTTATGANQ